MEKNSNTRSGLLWEVERILKETYNSNKNNLPKYLVLENVKNIISQKHNIAYEQWLNELKKLGYISKTYKLNSINFNSPQSRERVFCISVREDIMKQNNFKFPELENIKQKNKKILKDILDIEYDKKLNLDYLLKYQLSNPIISSSNIKKSTLKGYTNFNSESYVYYEDYSGPTLTASGANSRIKIYTNDKTLRKMSAKECYRYMGFSDEDYENVAKTKLLNETKIIYTAGNSIVVSVLEEIFKSFKF